MSILPPTNLIFTLSKAYHFGYNKQGQRTIAGSATAEGPMGGYTSETRPSVPIAPPGGLVDATPKAPAGMGRPMARYVHFTAPKPAGAANLTPDQQARLSHDQQRRRLISDEDRVRQYPDHVPYMRHSVTHPRRWTGARDRAVNQALKIPGSIVVHEPATEDTEAGFRIYKPPRDLPAPAAQPAPTAALSPQSPAVTPGAVPTAPRPNPRRIITHDDLAAMTTPQAPPVGNVGNTDPFADTPDGTGAAPASPEHQAKVNQTHQLIDNLMGQMLHNLIGQHPPDAGKPKYRYVNGAWEQTQP